MHCWKGYKKVGTHKEGKKTYNTCVKSGVGKAKASKHGKK